MRRRDLLDQLIDAVGDGTALLQPDAWQEELGAVCRAAQLAFGAAAVSVARVDGDHLRYVAAAGAGADAIVGAELGTGRGLGGWVAATGQALVVDDPAADPRFGRDVAERTGFVPRTMLIVPVHDATGSVIGVLSVLDRSIGAADALELGSAFAVLAGGPLASGELAASVGRALLLAVADARGSVPADLAAALRRAVQRAERDDEAELLGLLATLADLRRRDDASRQRLLGVIDEIVALSGRRR